MTTKSKHPPADDHYVLVDVPEDKLMSFCGDAECRCSLSDSSGPCEEYMEAHHPLGRCARCGWQHHFVDEVHP